eukprot:TRINITY_DN34_c0_g1_i17.p1 TRINITY_DN34_c0_g1~~TRINITY_DN34_c0_g1_i17.p1  ORF type:complete len:146 (+),score=3.51 TRINITY_DN34_c0_g1_i17:299-736(+)
MSSQFTSPNDSPKLQLDSNTPPPRGISGCAASLNHLHLVTIEQCHMQAHVNPRTRNVSPHSKYIASLEMYRSLEIYRSLENISLTRNVSLPRNISLTQNSNIPHSFQIIARDHKDMLLSVPNRTHLPLSITNTHYQNSITPCVRT